MPGYVIHLAEAELILDKMRKLRQTDDAFEQAFLTGTLLPDTRLKGEKRFSHFWDPDKLECLALGPDLARFTDKYGQRLNEPVMLGYLAHLHLDARYVTEYWPTVMAFYGCTGEPEYRKAHIAEVEIKRLHFALHSVTEGHMRSGNAAAVQSGQYEYFNGTLDDDGQCD